MITRSGSNSNDSPRRACHLRFANVRSRHGCHYEFQENRTSFPGSISKSSTNESSVFGLITSSMNFT